MAKDAVATMGAILPDDAGGRDAVHVAVFSATSPDVLFAGAKVAIVFRGMIDAVVELQEAESVGIVDPYINGDIQPGQRFWVYLYPRTITALSHKWSHPAFEQSDEAYVPPSQKLISEKWLRDYCLRGEIPSYEVFMSAVKDQVLGSGKGKYSDSLHINGQDASGEIPKELWQHVENVLGQQLPANKPEYFSCSC